jgi:hypothetical protein
VPPAYLGDYQRYLVTPGAVMGDSSANAPDAGQLYGSRPVNSADAVPVQRPKQRLRLARMFGSSAGDLTLAMLTLVDTTPMHR